MTMVEDYDEPIGGSKVYKSITDYQHYLGLPKNITICIFGICSVISTFFGFNLIFAVPAFLIIFILKLIVKDDPIILEILIKNLRYPARLS